MDLAAITSPQNDGQVQLTVGGQRDRRIRNGGFADKVELYLVVLVPKLKSSQCTDFEVGAFQGGVLGSHTASHTASHSVVTEAC